MYRASTPTYVLEVPFPREDLSELLLTFKQGDEVVLEKRLSENDFTIEGNVWSVMLTQEETNKFKADDAEAQLRVLFTDGTSLPSRVFRLSVLPVLNDEVMA